MAQDSDEVARNGGPVTRTPPATSPPTASTDDLRAQIQETRAEMSQTINAIQERLSPDHLLTETTETVKDATVGRAKQLVKEARRAAVDLASDSFENPARIVQRVKANPVPVAIVGAAATWLAVRTLRRSRAHASDRAMRPGEVRPARRRLSARSRVRQSGRLLIGVGTGMAWWGIWQVRHPVSRRASWRRYSDETIRHPSEPIGSQPS
jgi:hypothetical protein